MGNQIKGEELLTEEIKIKKRIPQSLKNRLIEAKRINHSSVQMQEFLLYLIEVGLNDLEAEKESATKPQDETTDCAM